MRRIDVPLFLAILWLIISVILLTLPGSDLPEESWLDGIYFDKWVHVGMFALLTFLWCWVMSKRKSVAVGLKTIFFEIALSAIVFGILMEFVQRYFVPGRSFDIGDMIADAAGALAGYFYSRWKFIKK
ncbi:MAG: VanZ family protein [Bacteroidetes bacterium]|nr:VanZ family protein [Bacteroidota bacterium]MBS1931658.1 VanZ family protein [Bacteroidota bacterium]